MLFRNFQFHRRDPILKTVRLKTGSLVAGFDPNMPLAGLSEFDAAGFEPKRSTGGVSDFGADDSLDDPKRFTAGLDAAVSEVVLTPNKLPPDGASSFFLSSVGAEADPVGFDPNKPPDPNPGFGRAGFSFSVSTGGALKLIPPPAGFRCCCSLSSSGGGVSGVIVFCGIQTLFR